MKPVIKTHLKIAFIATILQATGVVNAQTQQELSSAGSVVKVTCKFTDGQMVGAGFVWPNANSVVTTLHTVAACPKIEIYSEYLGKPTRAKLVKAMLEADLALLELDDKQFGLPPLKLTAQQPRLREEFSIWGYPRLIPKLKADVARFSGSLPSSFSNSENVQTLGVAFFGDPDLLEKQLGEQPYPSYDMRILKLGSTIQQGHSGSPIMNKQGQVIAIADGGLYDGTRGINWAIPAAHYLPRLIAATTSDPLPQKRSQQAILHSAFKPAEEITVPFERNDGDVGHFVLEQHIPFDKLESLLGKESALSRSMIESTKGFIEIDPTLQETLGFDVYRDTETGASIALPSILKLKWNQKLGLLEARNQDNSIGLFVGVLRGTSFSKASTQGKDNLTAHFDKLIELDQPLTSVEYSVYSPENQYAGLSVVLNGQDRATTQPSSIVMDIDVNGNDLMGMVVHSVGELEKKTGSQLALYNMMQLSVDFSGSSIAKPLSTTLSEQVKPQSTFKSNEEIRAPIERIEAGGSQFVLEQHLSFHELENLLGKESLESTRSFFQTNPELQNKLGIDIYLNMNTGDSIAVPTGLNLKWNQQFEMLEARNDDGSIGLFIGLLRGNNFAEVATLGKQNVATYFDKLINLDPPLSSTPYNQYNAESGSAYLRDILKGQDRVSGQSSGIVIDLEVSGNNFKSMIVHRVGDLEKKSDLDLARYNLMQKARQLSGFSSN